MGESVRSQIKLKYSAKLSPYQTGASQTNSSYLLPCEKNWDCISSTYRPNTYSLNILKQSSYIYYNMIFSTTLYRGVRDDMS